MRRLIGTFAAAVVFAGAGTVSADVPSVFPSTYDGPQVLALTATAYVGGYSRTISRRIRDDGSIVIDSASALHFEPAYPGGFSSAATEQTGRRTLRFTFDAASLQIMTDYYKQQFIDAGLVRTTDDFRLTFGPGRLEFRNGVTKLRGSEKVRVVVRRGARLLARGGGRLTWRGTLR
jgi:hypothetical protein